VAYGPTRKGAGQRRQRVQLQSPTTTLDTTRARVTTWTTYGSCAGAIDQAPMVKSEQQNAMIYLVTIPYRTDVLQGHRVLAPGLTLKVIADPEDPQFRHRELILHCAKVTQ
jgi:SPP1 family predicted phage head-tail adaptor